jgi:ribonuclease E
MATDTSSNVAPVAVNGPAQETPRSDQGQDRPPRNSARGERSGRGERSRNERTDNAEQGSPNQRGEVRTDTRNERRPDRNRPSDEAPRTDLAMGEVSRTNADLDNGTGEPGARAEGAETREKRSRDRYGRDRGPRADRAEQDDRPERSVPAVPALPEDSAAEPRKSYFTPHVEASTMDTVAAAVPIVPDVFEATSLPAAPVTSKPVPEPVLATTAPITGMPKLQNFVLPLTELAEVAQSSGLSWVNSDAEKIAAVQAAIAAEPKGIHVPRERPAVVNIDTGSLILVETKRDLRNMTLPFEAP